jgi:hypothetical protein
MTAFAFTDVLEPAGDKPIRVLARISVLRTEDGGRKGLCLLKNLSEAINLHFAD